MTFYHELEKLAKASIERYTKIELLDEIVIAKHPDGLYSIYLPNRIDTWSYKLRDGLFCVFTNVEKYKYENDGEPFLLVKIRTSPSKGFWTAIYPQLFAWFLTSERCRLRVESLPKVEFKGKTKAKILQEFSYLKTRLFYMVEIDGKKFSFRYSSLSMYSDTADIVLTSFDDIEPLPFYNCFKATINGEFTFLDISGEQVLGPAHSIEKISEYPFLDRHSGFFSKNDEGKITGLYIGSYYHETNYFYSYKFIFSIPIEKIKFVERIIVNRDLVHGTHYPKQAVDIWLAEYVNGERKFLFKEIGDERSEFEVNYSDLF